MTWTLLGALATLVLGCATGGAVPSGVAEGATVSALEQVERRARAAVDSAPRRDGGPFTLRGALVLTAAGQRFDPGFIVVEAGRIEAIGQGEPVRPRGPVIDVDGHVITPGLIDTHSHLGVYPSPPAAAHGDGNEMTSPTTADVWAEHAVWTQDPGFEAAARGGVTTLHILPGSANLIGGRGVTLRVRPARSARAMRLEGAPDSLKLACGENPKRTYGRRNAAPSTRMGNVRGHRAAFIAARKWLADHRDKAADQIPRDLAMESLVGVLEGRILAQVHCYRADDMVAMLQVADELGVPVRAFHHATEAYKIRDLLAARAIGVATWADWWGFKLEAYDAIEENLALVTEAGGRAMVHSDSSEGIQRLNQEAAKAFYSGLAAGVALDEDDALRWITANPAWALGIDDEVGALEVGKRADLVVWDRHPFSVYAKARWVYLDGVRIIDTDVEAPPWSDFAAGQGVTP